MSPKLSIIIPCYNCTATLEEAVDSVYAQNFTIPFELVMVDDRSKDTTIDIMQKLASIHPEIKLFYHDENKGGGATRNTGIKNSTGDLIFCLDSDNLLFPNSLQAMIDYLDEKHCDGVVIHERRYFQEKDQEHFSAHINTILEQPIRLENLFDESNTLLDNFLFTKKAYDKTDGYPEGHGFDTQCFEIRYFAAGNTAHICPGSIFLHRQAINSKGYFHRVYEEGMFSVNFYLIYEEILYLFSEDSINDIINYDIFSNNKLGKDNIKAFFSNKFAKIGIAIFRDNFATYLTINGAKKYAEQYSNPVTSTEKFVKATSLLRARKYKEAYNIFQILTSDYPHSKVIPYNMARCELLLEGTLPVPLIEHAAIAKSGSLVIRRKMALNTHPVKILLVRMKRLLAKVYRHI